MQKEIMPFFFFFFKSRMGSYFLVHSFVYRIGRLVR
jgi:hypothetical protein